MNTSDRPPTMQFSVRTLLLVILAISLLCAIVTPLVRHWPLERQLRLLAVFPAAILPGLILFCKDVRKRWKSEQKAGAKLMESCIVGSRWARAIGWLLIPIWIFLIVYASSLATSEIPFHEDVTLDYVSELLFVFSSMYVLIAFSSTAFSISPIATDRTKVYAREFWQHGLLIGSQLRPWDEVYDFQWSERNNQAVLEIEWKNHKKCKFYFPVESTEEANEILDRHVTNPKQVEL